MIDHKGDRVATSPKKRSSKKGPPTSVVGWREWVRLPDLCEFPMKAKIDTGARTSSLHAFDLRVEETDGVAIASFEIHPAQRSARDATRVRLEVDGFRLVRSSSGHRERRPVIRTPIVVGTRQFKIDVTLTSRDEMGFRMLLGRSALRRRFLVDPGRSFSFGDTP